MTLTPTDKHTGHISGGFPNLLLDSNVTVSDECFKTLPCDGRPTGMGFLIDGSDGAPHLRNYWHSCSTGHDAWAKFTLQQVSSIFRIEVVNRHDCCESRLTGSSVFVFDTQSQEEVFCGNVTATGRGATAYLETTTCSVASRRAGYVKIYGPKGGKEYLHISEVKAFGVTTANKCTAPTPSTSSTTTPTSTITTPAPTLSSPAPGCKPIEKIIYKSWQENPGRKDWGRPGHSHCVQPYTWGELLKGYKDKYIPYKVGGLGKLLEPGGYQTWVCLLDDHPCGDPHYCWVYHETDKVFTAWGTNTELGLHFK